MPPKMARKKSHNGMMVLLASFGLIIMGIISRNEQG